MIALLENNLNDVNLKGILKPLKRAFEKRRSQ